MAVTIDENGTLASSSDPSQPAAPLTNGNLNNAQTKAIDAVVDRVSKHSLRYTIHGSILTDPKDTQADKEPAGDDAATANGVSEDADLAIEVFRVNKDGRRNIVQTTRTYSVNPPPSDEAQKHDASKPPEGVPFIKYKNIYSNRRDDIVSIKTAYEPISVKGLGSDREAVFDVVAKCEAAETMRYWGYRSNNDDEIPEVLAPPEYSIVIRSRAVIRAIQSIVEYYPEVEIWGETIEIAEPYGILVHHYKELTAYRRSFAPDSRTISSETEDSEVFEHLGLLMDYLDTHIMPKVYIEWERHRRGVATWDMLWLSFKPGQDVVAFNSKENIRGGIEKRSGYVIESLSGGPRANTRKKWTIYIWNLHYDGKHINRNRSARYVPPFDGEMSFSQLEVLPVDSAGSSRDGIPLRTYLERQGEKFFGLLKPQCMHHKGELLEFPYHKIEGQVMVDIPVYLEQTVDKASRLPCLDEYSDPVTFLWDVLYRRVPTRGSRTEPPMYAPPHKNSKIPRFSNYDNILPELVGELTPHQYFLCPQSVWVYVFRTRKWQSVDVSNLSAPRFKPGMIDTLVMDSHSIRHLKALASSFIRYETGSAAANHQHWSADFVEGKGNSQIFLLHGQPGVGKTYTAECIAEHTRRPLMTLTCSDIGTDPASIEYNLETHFKTARKWEAILLIDEADIYLERRSQTDLTRNSLVAGFLRALEVYEGILFLTTNRVGAFDDAFMSRIHVTMYYRPLSDAYRKQIWNNFFKKLERERGDRIRVMGAAKDFLSREKMMSLKLNGREIRNIFQTAVSLAEYDAHLDEEGKIMLEEEHLDQVAEMSGKFKHYLNDLLIGDESERAARQAMRLDTYADPDTSGGA